MIDGARLATRMAAMEVSQSELARRIGISQATVWKLVHGTSRTSGHIARIARELGTTPAYLEGEADDPDADAPPAPALDSEARELIDNFTDLSPADRRALLQISRSMASNAPGGETVHAPATEFRPEPSPAEPRTKPTRGMK